MLAGCGAVRFTYNQGPQLSYWWLDRYVDFTATQSAQTKEALQRWFAWHRATQLADYAELLVQAQNEAAQNVTPEQVCHWYGEIRKRIEPALDFGLPLAVEVAQSLTPVQLRHIEQRYKKTNEEFRADHLKGNAEERLQTETKRAVERAEDFYGRLSEAQRKLLTQAAQASPWDAEASLRERQARQADTLQTLRLIISDQAHPTQREQVLVGLRVLARRLLLSPRPDYHAYEQRLFAHNCATAAALHNSAGAAQRQHLRNKLKGWEEDARALMASAPAAN